MYRLIIKGNLRFGQSDVAGFTKVLGDDISLAQAVDRAVKLLSSGYRGHAVSSRYGAAIEVGSDAMNVRLTLTMADGSDAGGARLQFNREVLDRLTMDGKMIREGLITG